MLSALSSFTVDLAGHSDPFICYSGSCVGLARSVIVVWCAALIQGDPKVFARMNYEFRIQPESFPTMSAIKSSNYCQ